ncbi:zinc ribbon domain-containing protein [Succinimonas amylolytica]|uniref:zinc ribbon domain-containing protein n=1 Tax=Succinimonas amylolytica TaxID=83769 RepID=UPI0003786F41|nr:zinc ribbon domain-containing protein [Succinimonas amylolytica]
MKCTQCGSEIPNGYEVCPRCKTIRARFCEKCGNSLGPRENFCSRCGAPRSGSQNEVRPELSPEEIRHTRELLQAFYAIETPLREQRRRILWGIGLQFVPLVNVFAGLPLLYYVSVKAPYRHDGRCLPESRLRILSGKGYGRQDSHKLALGAGHHYPHQLPGHDRAGGGGDY